MLSIALDLRNSQAYLTPDVQKEEIFSWIFVVTAEPQEKKEDEVDTIEPAETIQSVAWLDMMYEESELTLTRANEAVTIIQVNKFVCTMVCFIEAAVRRIASMFTNVPHRELTDDIARGNRQITCHGWNRRSRWWWKPFSKICTREFSTESYLARAFPRNLVIERIWW